MSFQQRHDMLYLNNRGVEYIHSKEFDTAISTLRAALTLLRQCQTSGRRGRGQRGVGGATSSSFSSDGTQKRQYQQQDENDDDYFYYCCCCCCFCCCDGVCCCCCCCCCDSSSDDDQMDIADWFSKLIVTMPYNNTNATTAPTLRLSSNTKTTKSFRSSCNQEEGDATHSFRTSLGYVYEHPLELPMDDHVALRLSVLRLTIMFNLAMAFHLKGLELVLIGGGGGTTTTTTAATTTPPTGHCHSCYLDDHHQQQNEEEAKWSFESAMKLYELTYEIIGTGPTTNSNSTVGGGGCIDEYANPGMYFLMSLTNNIGMVHVMLCRYDYAQLCFQRLLSMQMYLVEHKLTIGGTGTTAAMDNGWGEDYYYYYYSTTTSNDDDDVAMLHPQEDNPRESMSLRTSPTRSSRHERQEEEQRRQMHPWNGFFHNTSQLILNNCCASAA